jgi:hypothetical protein
MGEMSDDERGRAALLEAIRDVVLDFKTEHEGHAITARYKPVVAMTLEKRLGTNVAEDSTPALTILNFYADLLFDLVVDGKTATMGRAAMTFETARLMLTLGPLIVAHAQEWLQAETEAQGQHAQRAARIVTRRQQR